MTVVPAHVERGCIVHCLITVGELLKFMKDHQERAFIAVGRTNAQNFLAAGDVTGAQAVASHIFKMALAQLAKEGLAREALTKRWLSDPTIHTRIRQELITAGYDADAVLAETDRRYKYAQAQEEARRISVSAAADDRINVRDVGIA